MHLTLYPPFCNYSSQKKKCWRRTASIFFTFFFNLSPEITRIAKPEPHSYPTNNAAHPMLCKAVLFTRNLKFTSNDPIFLILVANVGFGIRIYNNKTITDEYYNALLATRTRSTSALTAAVLSMPQCC